MRCCSSSRSVFAAHCPLHLYKQLIANEQASVCLYATLWQQVEVQVLQSMHHPNIIHIEDVYLTDTKICMVRSAASRHQASTHLCTHTA